MQIVIEVDDDLYTRLFDKGDEYVADMRRACVAIRKGTPLPKGHGRLIDADALNFNADYYEPLISKRDFDFAPTIIEADRAESEG